MQEIFMGATLFIAQNTAQQYLTASALRTSDATFAWTLRKLLDELANLNSQYERRRKERLERRSFVLQFQGI